MCVCQIQVVGIRPFFSKSIIGQASNSIIDSESISSKLPIQFLEFLSLKYSLIIQFAYTTSLNNNKIHLKIFNYHHIYAKWYEIMIVHNLLCYN